MFCYASALSVQSAGSSVRFCHFQNERIHVELGAHAHTHHVAVALMMTHMLTAALSCCSFAHLLGVVGLVLVQNLRLKLTTAR